MADMNFKVNKAGMNDFVKSQAVGDAMYGVAQEAAAYAKSIAPVGTGDYRDSITAEQVTVPVTKRNEPRAGAMISTNLDYSAAVEGRDHVLSRTADYMNRKGA